MGNAHYYTAERNNYFFGKLMTAKDFKNEQNYFNSKRFLNNRMFGGVGIILGLDIILMDNRTFSLETGMAIDYLGREIIVSEPCIRKLNVLRGFEENREKRIVYLCIEYKEHLSESTFSVASAGKEQGGEKQYNRICESYDLFLTSEEPIRNELTLEYLVKNQTEIINVNGVKLILESFKYINSNRFTQVKIIFEKEKLEDPVSYKFEFYGNLFKNSPNTQNKNVTVKYDETEITTYKNIKTDYYLYCDAQESALTEIIIPKESFNLIIGRETYKLDKNISIPIQVVTEDIRNIIVKDYYSRHFDEVLEVVENKNIYLAKFNLVNNKTTYFIEEFKKHPFNQYLYSNDLLKILQEFQGENVKSIDTESKIKFESKEKNEDDKKINSEIENNINLNKISSKDNILTGVERINLGFNAKIGRTYYSYEFVHGLGEGEISVTACSVNHEKLEEHEKMLLIFGDKSIFSQEEVKASVPNVQIGAVVDPTKGTMKLGVRILEKTFYNYIDIRWWVYKPLEDKEAIKDLILDQNATLKINPNTISIKPFTQVRFEATIEKLNDKRVKWELTQKHTGNIDNNGLYTAPATEGVYEIKAYSVRMPEVFSSAYVIVSAEDTDAIGDNVPLNINENKPLESENLKKDKSSPESTNENQEKSEKIFENKNNEEQSKTIPANKEVDSSEDSKSENNKNDTKQK